MLTPAEQSRLDGALLRISVTMRLLLRHASEVAAMCSFDGLTREDVDGVEVVAENTSDGKVYRGEPRPEDTRG